jgi:hypothetical protein
MNGALAFVARLLSGVGIPHVFTAIKFGSLICIGNPRHACDFLTKQQEVMVWVRRLRQ